MPYFIQSLLFAEKLRYGYSRGKVSGEAQTVKFSFADPSNAQLQAYMAKNIGRGNDNFKLENLQTFSAENKATIKNALQQISHYTQLTFEETDAFLNYGEGINFFIFPFQAPEGKTYFGYAFEGGDVNLNSLLFQQAADGSALSIEPKNQGFTTVLHEVLHSLGFKHPFEESEDHHHGHDHVEHGNEVILNDAEDGTMLTLMSYKTDINDHSDSLRPFDLAALHYRYGVNKAQRTGDDIYTFKTFNSQTADGDIYIWDGGGVDTFNAANEQQGVYVNLTPGSWIHSGKKEENLVASGVDSVTKSDYFNSESSKIQIEMSDEEYKSSSLNDILNRLYPAYQIHSGQAFIGYGTVIENAVGSDFDDTLIGNDADNLLEGGKGKDRLVGGKGNDVLNGGEGADIMEGGEDDDIYFVDDAGDRIIEAKDEGNDKVFSTVSIEKAFEHVEAYQLLGRENLEIDAGYVKIIEEIPRSEASTSNVVSDPYGRTIETIENGSNGIRTITRINSTDLTLTGNAGDNKLVGGDGNDVIDGGEGADMMIGGFGNDVYYVDNIGDQIIEVGGQGYDTVISSIETFSISQGQSIEKVELTEGSKAQKVDGFVDYQSEIIGNSNDNIFDLYAFSSSVTSITGKGGVNSYKFTLEVLGSSRVEPAALGSSIVSDVDIEPITARLPGFTDLQNDIASGQRIITGKTTETTTVSIYQLLDVPSATLGEQIAKKEVGEDNGNFAFVGVSLGSTRDSAYAFVDDNMRIRAILKFDSRGNDEINGVDNSMNVISPAITLSDFKQGIDEFKLSYHTGDNDEANAQILKEISLQDNQIVHTEQRYNSQEKMLYTTKSTLVSFGTNVTEEILAHVEVA